jgi:hypothetical protein
MPRLGMAYPQQTLTKEFPVRWDALANAFENNSADVKSYLRLETGEVFRAVAGIARTEILREISSSDDYVRIDPIRSREQYRWMDQFVASVEDDTLREALLGAMDGGGAFKRFKVALLDWPEERECWYAFRATRVRAFMEAWLLGRDILAVDERAPISEVRELRPGLSDAAITQARLTAPPGPRTKSELVWELREVVGRMNARQVSNVTTYAEFLRSKRFG